MRMRVAATLIGVVMAAGLAGHFLGGHAAPMTPPAPRVPAAPPLQVPAIAGQYEGSHVLWLAINGRLRAVPP